MKVLLTVAGFDPTGGAGILRDIWTFSYFGFKGAAAITVNTAQNTKGVVDFEFQKGDLILKQIELIAEEMEILGVKIGIPHRELQVNRLIASAIRDLNVPVAFDPVLSPTFGREFVDEIGVLEPLIEMATVVTPNYSEFLTLRKFDLEPKCLVVKGFPLDGEVLDVLVVEGKEVERVVHLRDSKEVRGTGCAFSSALLSLMVSGLELKEAFLKAVEFVSRYRESSYKSQGMRQYFPKL